MSQPSNHMGMALVLDGMTLEELYERTGFVLDDQKYDDITSQRLIETYGEEQGDIKRKQVYPVNHNAMFATPVYFYEPTMWTTHAYEYLKIEQGWMEKLFDPSQQHEARSFLSDLADCLNINITEENIRLTSAIEIDE